MPSLLAITSHFFFQIAVILLTAQAWAINRIAGLDYPIWERKQGVSSTE